MAAKDNPQEDVYFRVGEAILANVPLSMVLTDPTRDDNPIIYVNSAFERLTGYTASAAVGRNCRFLQGEDRDQEEIRILADAIAARESVTVTLKNTRADGRTFRNRLMISPILDPEGELQAFLGIQTEVLDTVPAQGTAVQALDDRLDEMQHRIKNHLQMVASLVRMQSTAGEGSAGYELLSRRIDALSLLYDEFSSPPQAQAPRYDVVSAGGYVSRVASTVGALDGRRDIRVTIDVDPVYMRSEPAGELGLVASEILSNTLQHAFEGRQEGLVSVSLKQGGGDRVRLTVSDDGVGMSSDWPREGNLGARIVQGLVQKLGGDLKVTTGPGGSVITLDLDNVLDTSLEPGGTRVVSDTARGRDGGPPALESD
ncbi:PAS domain-containing protein [Jannaschia seohaensis]|uniref:PAS domain S-box-containing protein n=1 Tax=Jannaschia seohaensis TaxID=475081 RepID=A0A2Y9ATD2_9RHOB|nr:PAS domain-containing protein [Jannaschia seohaensis]PWJ18064.1 PAS domain S-box-containing protein [Jannaschia seohaensis]SSA46588.1 PAS domain S-box-containing protein [Jannaschia seohaensis]